MNPKPLLSLDPETPHRERPEKRPAAPKEESAVNGNNVTLKLVSICGAVAMGAFVLGGWAGDVKATSARHDAELVELRSIAKDIRSMMSDMNTRVKSIEDWREGQSRLPSAPR